MADCKENKEDANRPWYLKVDPPRESSGESPENSTSESMEQPETTEDSKESQETPSSSSKPILAASKFATSFGGNDFSKSLTKKRRSSILWPSQLGTVTNSQPTTKSYLQPAKFQNPFTKLADPTTDEKNDSTKENSKTEEKEEKVEDKVEKEDKNEMEEVKEEVKEEKSEVKEEESDEKTETKEEKSEEKETAEAKETKSEEKPVEEVKPTFLMLGATTKDTVNSTVAPCTSEPNFVFGQNLQERVMIANDAESSEKSETEEKKEEKKEENSNENGSTELLFSAASAACRTTSKPSLSLTEAAQELEEANRANKRKYSQITPLTGEEGETNVLQINCKFFAFDKASGSWQERGRGTLRLNDRDEESRLVGRTAGTQRLILNTKVWPGMTAERAALKSLRLTAMDVVGSIRIFTVQAAPKEVEQLHNLLQQRLKRAQERQPKKLATDH
ncbi:ran-binding protein 3 [Ceratina calcarata]|uniref:Ran-binding protein 3 n=1 Tax=Ceratina calcarata TaxID=156304 RepID=A0AAJ7NFS8_9HYME|nr:ran-binding protein 3 [Ceratina calcarata]